MITAGTYRISTGMTTPTAPEKANAVSPMARYAYQYDRGEQVRDALASRVFVLSDVVAVQRMVSA